SLFKTLQQNHRRECCIMARATKIRMNDSKGFSNDVTEIKDIYLTGVKQPAYYSKESIYDFIKGGNTVDVNIYPYPKLIPAMRNGQRYVRSEPNDTPNDNLLKLPRD
ncbi:DUF3892 domain-containing protein, partial [Enterococcus faecium]